MHSFSFLINKSDCRPIHWSRSLLLQTSSITRKQIGSCVARHYTIVNTSLLVLHELAQYFGILNDLTAESSVRTSYINGEMYDQVHEESTIAEIYRYLVSVHCYRHQNHSVSCFRGQR